MSSIIERARALRPLIEKAVVSLDDGDALKAIALYPEWKAGVKLTPGDRVRYEGELYKVKNGGEHTTQADWTPDLARSLFEKICESASGTLDDPIPYSGGMVLEEGKYYAESGVVYRCFRGSGIAVYHAIHELVGLYVEYAGEV